jgi:hypothetical protein
MAKTNYDAISFKNKDVDKFSQKFNTDPPVVLPPTRVRVDTVDKTNNDKKNFKEFIRTSSADGETSSLTVSKNKAGGVSKDKNYFLSTDKSGSSLSTTKNGKEKITTGPAAERKFSRAVRKNT